MSHNSRIGHVLNFYILHVILFRSYTWSTTWLHRTTQPKSRTFPFTGLWPLPGSDICKRSQEHHLQQTYFCMRTESTCVIPIYLDHLMVRTALFYQNKRINCTKQWTLTWIFFLDGCCLKKIKNFSFELFFIDLVLLYLRCHNAFFYEFDSTFYSINRPAKIRNVERNAAASLEVVQH